MVAVAYSLAEGGTATGRPRLVVAAGLGGALRPVDRRWPVARCRPVVSSRQDAAVYRRRRAVAVVLLAMGVLLAWLSLRALLAGPAGGTLPASGSAGIGILQPAAVHIHVVQPGETLWSIVAGTGPSGDPRPEVDRLARQLGGRPLQVGQRLIVP